MKLINNFTKDILLFFSDCFPIKIKKLIFWRYAQSLGVQSFQYRGKLGLFEGSTSDQSIFDNYFKSDTRSPFYQKLLSDVLFAAGKGTYIDIGANIGLTIIPIAKKRGIKCYGFEPEARNFKYLQSNIAANALENHITIFNCALFSDDGTIKMELSENNKGDHRIHPKHPQVQNLYNEQVREIIEIKACKLDSLLNVDDLEKPVVMKIDTQGAEVDVLKGASKFLQGVDFLITEFWPYGLIRLGHTVDSFIELIRSFPYGQVFDDDRQELRLQSIEEVIQKMKDIPHDGSSKRHIDILFTKTSLK